MITIEEATGFGLTLNVIADLEAAHYNALTAAENGKLQLNESSDPDDERHSSNGLPPYSTYLLTYKR